MPEEPRLNPAQREIEAALGALAPAAPAIDRDELMYRAGRASAPRRARLPWALTLLLAVGLTVALAVRPEPRIVERVVHVPAAPPAAPAEPVRHPQAPAPAIAMPLAVAMPLSPNSYVRLRTEVLRGGLDALAKLQPARDPAPRADVIDEQFPYLRSAGGRLLGLPELR